MQYQFLFIHDLQMQDNVRQATEFISKTARILVKLQ